MTSYIKNYASRSGAEIKIRGIIPKKTVTLPAFVTSFSDSMTSSWNEEAVYGRPDVIGTYQNTQRRISIGFDLPSMDLAEAKKNLDNINKIKQFMYPAYNSNVQPASSNLPQVTTNALSLAKAPLVRIKFANLIDSDNEHGLLGWIASFTATPVIDMGMFNEGSEKNAKLYPKVYNVSIDFVPQHEFDLGYKVGAAGEHTAIDKSKFTKFPYDGGT